MNNTKIVAICAVIILIAVSSFVVINANDKTENDYNPDIPDSDYYPITVKTINPTTNEMVDMTFTKRPTSVVVNEGGSLEMMANLGLEDLISEAFVKDSYFGDGEYHLTNPHLAEQLDKVVIKTRSERSLEYVTLLDPDFVIGWSEVFRDSSSGSFEYWGERKVPTYVTNEPADTVEKNLKHYENMGKIFNVEKKAQEYVDSFNKSVNIVKDKIEGIEENKKPKVLTIELYSEETIYVYGSEYLTGELIELAGGANTFDGGFTRITLEKIVDLFPDLIILVVNSGDLRDEEYIQTQFDNLYAIEGFKSIPAIVNKNVVDYGLYEVYGAGCLPTNIVERLYEDFHPGK